MQRKDWGKYELLMNKFTLLDTNILTEIATLNRAENFRPVRRPEFTYPAVAVISESG
jgi:hypothetical protein